MRTPGAAGRHCPAAGADAWGLIAPLTGGGEGEERGAAAHMAPWTRPTTSLEWLREVATDCSAARGERLGEAGTVGRPMALLGRLFGWLGCWLGAHAWERPRDPADQAISPLLGYTQRCYRCGAERETDCDR